MKIFSTLAPSLRRNLLVLFVAGLLFWSSLAALLPTLPLYIQHIGGSEQQIGIVMGCFAIGLLGSRAWLGRLADQRSRKIVLLIGVVAVAIAPLGYLVLPSIPLMMGIRAFHGISIAAFAMAYSALVVDLSPPENRGELIGYMTLVNPIGVAVGPALGGFLQSWAGYPPLFLLSAVLGFISLVFTAKVQEPPKKLGGTATEDNPSTPFWQLLWSDRVRIPAVIMLLIGLSFGTLSTFVPLFIEESRVTLNAGLFYTVAAIASFTIRLVVGRASDRFGRGLFISLSLLCYTCAMITLWRATSAPMFLVAGFLEGSGMGILIPMTSALMADRAHPQERGRIFAVCMVGFDLGIAIAGPSLGFVAALTDYRTLFSLAGGLSLSACLIFITFGSKDLAHSLRYAIGLGRDVYALPKHQSSFAP